MRRKILPGKSFRPIAGQVNKGRFSIFHKKRLLCGVRSHPYGYGLAPADGVNQAAFPGARLAKQHNGHVFCINALQLFLNAFPIPCHSAPICISASSRSLA